MFSTILYFYNLYPERYLSAAQAVTLSHTCYQVHVSTHKTLYQLRGIGAPVHFLLLHDLELSDF